MLRFSVCMLVRLLGDCFGNKNWLRCGQVCCDVLSVDCTGEWFLGLFSGRFLLRSNFLVILGLIGWLGFRVVIGYWHSRSGSGMTVVMWLGMIAVMKTGAEITMHLSLGMMLLMDEILLVGKVQVLLCVFL